MENVFLALKKKKKEIAQDFCVTGPAKISDENRNFLTENKIICSCCCKNIHDFFLRF